MYDLKKYYFDDRDKTVIVLSSSLSITSNKTIEGGVGRKGLNEVSSRYHRDRGELQQKMLNLNREEPRVCIDHLSH